MKAQQIKEDSGPAVSVRKTLTVNASVSHAFKVFTEKHGTWWPRNTHHIGAQIPETVIIEPRAGGRWFERAADGSECDWGKVLAWEPPGRLVLCWQLNTEWHYDPDLSTEVEVRFIAEGPRTTRVEFEHRNLERFGSKTEEMRRAFESEGGWTGILQGFVAAAGE